MTLDTNGKEKADKYHRILEAAIKVFAEQGFFRSTISQIAKEAGVADGTIYLYFKNKDDILLQFYSDKTRNIFNAIKNVFKVVLFFNLLVITWFFIRIFYTLYFDFIIFKGNFNRSLNLFPFKNTIKFSHIYPDTGIYGSFNNNFRIFISN